jgi:uncharacterized protein
MLSPSRKIYCAPSRIENGGRGVFAAVDIRKDELVERCPVIMIQEENVALIEQSELLNYYFLWGDINEKGALCLGFGSLYNHSYEPNATYVKNLKEQTIDFVAIKGIGKDEEITVNYNDGDPNNKRPLWIKSIKSPGQES